MACNFDNKEDHCCYLNGPICPHLVENEVDGGWACGLFVKYGDWDQVIASTEYLADVDPRLSPFNINCRDYPKGKYCGTCGRSE